MDKRIIVISIILNQTCFIKFTNSTNIILHWWNIIKIHFLLFFFPKKNLHLQFKSGGTTKLKLYISYIRKKIKKR